LRPIIIKAGETADMKGFKMIEENNVADGVVTKSVVEETKLPPRSAAIQVVYILFSILAAIIILRVILVGAGANPANGFVDFIYNISEPFVKPFLTMFDREIVYKVGRFEYESIIALIVYGIVAAIIASILRIGRRTNV
jgi:uncharacterized protein YggT (Ycf19 family)